MFFPVVRAPMRSSYCLVRYALPAGSHHCISLSVLSVCSYFFAHAKLCAPRPRVVCSFSSGRIGLQGRQPDFRLPAADADRKILRAGAALCRTVGTRL